MDICNCNLDLDAYLCDIPHEWREGIVKALCLTLQSVNLGCTPIKKCETLTSLSGFTLQGGQLSITYKDENGYLNTSDVDLSLSIEDSLDEIDPSCLMSQEDWDDLTNLERIQAILDAHCNCCSTTTTTTTSTTTTSTSTTTTTTSAFTFYTADAYTCEGVCVLDELAVIAVPNAFIVLPGTFYAADPDDGRFYKIVGNSLTSVGAIVLDTATGTIDCDSFCSCCSIIEIVLPGGE